MKNMLDECELSFPVNVMNRILYQDVLCFQLDIYYNDHGFPKHVHDEYGAAGVNEFRLILVNQIIEKNGTDDIWRVSSDAFAIISKPSNCGGFEINYKSLIMKIKKKTILISSLAD